MQHKIMSEPELYEHDFSRTHTNLLDDRLGACALSCSDDWFAECGNLVKSEVPIFKPRHFVSTGQWMDGWESRRSFDREERRNSGIDHDWCVLRMAREGCIVGVDVDTSHFTGNAPQQVSVEGCWVEGEVDDAADWQELLPRCDVDADSHNFLPVPNNARVNHLRLKIYPDGGVARFRAYGKVMLDPNHFVDGEMIDLASVLYGGRGLLSSDMFYSAASNMLMPARGINMGDGWETRRSRSTDPEWSIIKLGMEGTIRKIIVDTAHFRGNNPDRFSLEACLAEDQAVLDNQAEWTTILQEQPLHPDREHLFIKQIAGGADQRYTHVRINIFPDGGISRLRVFGMPNWDSLS